MPPTFVSGIPIYVQIADSIRAQILRGALRDGDQLTSTTEYATTYRINPATAGKDLHEGCLTRSVGAHKRGDGGVTELKGEVSEGLLYLPRIGVVDGVEGDHESSLVRRSAV